MTCEHKYKQHTWGRSYRLSPLNTFHEIHVAVMNKPCQYSSVHTHWNKTNRVICNEGSVQIDLFNWGLTPEDIMRGEVCDSDFDTITLFPEKYHDITAGLYHRISTVEPHSIITEVYFPVGYLPPDPEDIERIIPACGYRSY